MGRASRLKRERKHPRAGALPPHLREQLARGELQLRRGDPPNQKISAALIELIRPYAEGDEALAAYRGMVGLAAVAWNLAQLEPGAAQLELARFSVELGKNRPDLMERCLREMIERKRRLFPHDHRVVAHWEVEDQGHQYYVRAASLS